MEKKVISGIMLTLVLISMLTLAFNVQIATQASSSSDWLSGWSYRKSHEINNSTGAGTNYQIKIKAHYGSGTDSGEDVYLNSNSRTDFGDVRFTDDNETTLLDYWMEEKVDGDYAVFWVEVADDLDSNVTIYIYYGNAAATTTKNGVNTFHFFDDFESYDLGDLNGQGGWSVTGNNPTHVDVVSSPVVEGIRGVKMYSTDTYVDHVVTPITKGKITVYLRSDTVAYRTGRWFVRLMESGTYRGQFYMDVDSPQHLRAGGTTILQTYFSDTWYKIEGAFDFVNDEFIEVWVDDMSKGTNIGFTNAGTQLDGIRYIGGGWVGYYGFMDMIRIRKYVDPEPSHGSWGVEESQIVTPTYALSIKLSGDFDYAPAENIKVKLAALVKDVDTMEAVSDANVTIDIYYPNGTLWVSDNMTERHVGTGIYEWESNDTIYEMNTEKDIYLVHVKASVGDGPVATDMLLFHIDPPPDNSTLSFTPLIYYVIAVALIAAGTLTGIALLRRYRKLQIAPK